MRAYQKHGLEGLKPGWKGGNHRKLSVQGRIELYQRLQNLTPEQALGRQEHGQGSVFWTVEDVAQVVEAWYGVRYNSRESYRMLLIEAGFSFQHPEGIYRSRPSEALIADFEAEAEKK